MSETRPVRYHQFAVWLHWILTVLIIAILVLGFFIMGNVPDAMKPTAYMIHKTLGILILYFTLVRIGWRLLNPPPPMVSTLKPVEKLLAKATHFLFYALTLGLPLSGWALVSTGRWPTMLAGLAEWPPLPFFAILDKAAKKPVHEFFEEGHEVAAYLLAALLILHILAVIKHHVADKDGTSARMIPGHLAKADAPKRPARGAMPLLVGIGALFAVWIFVGAPMKSYQPPKPAEASAPALAQPTTEPSAEPSVTISEMPATEPAPETETPAAAPATDTDGDGDGDGDGH